MQWMPCRSIGKLANIVLLSLPSLPYPLPLVAVNSFLINTPLLLIVGCGALLDNYLLDIKSASFKVSSGNPGTPLLSEQPWVPTTLDVTQNLTVNAGNYIWSISIISIIFPWTLPWYFHDISIPLRSDFHTMEFMSKRLEVTTSNLFPTYFHTNYGSVSVFPVNHPWFR
jgi:hypothetical protein